MTEQLASLLKQSETLTLDDKARKDSGYTFVKTAIGYTRYELKGEGQAVVLTHGYATPYHIYDKLFKALTEKGFKVLRYDLLGRGMSDRPVLDYTPEVFARQLDEITDALIPDQKFFLCGSSMGGTVTTCFCSLHPEKVKGLMLFAPAGMDTFKPPLYMKLCSKPVVGDALFNLIGAKTLTTRCADQLWHCTEEDRNYYMTEFAKCARYKGFLKSTLSSLRNTILNTKHDTEGYIAVEKLKLPLMVIWGTKDQTMPFYQHTRLLEVCPSVEFHILDDAGHDFIYDETAKALPFIFAFIDKINKGE